MRWSYPAGSLDALIASDAVTAPTRAALQARGQRGTRPAFFTRDEFTGLTAMVARLAPWPELAPVIASAIDARLAAGTGNGWRFATLPDDGAAYRMLLGLLDAGNFRGLGPMAQDDLLLGVQSRPDAARAFEDLLAEVSELAFAQPAALAAIGYTGFADAPGWTAIQFDEREPREAIEHG